VIDALTPAPENFNVTSPGGTPVSSNIPLPSTVEEMFVPLIETVSVVDAFAVNVSHEIESTHGVKLTRPK
jgi:hypothetical protein